MRTENKKLKGKAGASGHLPTGRGRGFTLLELLIVIVIIITLGALITPGMMGLINSARATKATYALRDMVNATINWSVDHGNRIPSPMYPGGHLGELPENAITTGTGLWCDGVIFAHLYPNTDPTSPPPSRATSGGHFIGTVFESIASVKAHPDKLDWYRHSYGMNSNLVYDELNKNSSDPWLTEKSLANIHFLSSAMIYIDSPNNIVDYAMAKAASTDEKSILDFGRYRGKYVLAAFLDGHVEKLTPVSIPMGDINTDRDASRFWRGVDP